MRRATMILWGMILFFGAQRISAQNVQYVGSYSTPGLARAVFISGTYAYVADGDSGLLIVDVSNQSNPAPAGSLQTGFPALDICMSGNFAIVAEGYCPWGCTGGLEIVDVANPGIPDSVGGFQTGLVDCISVSGSYAFFTATGTFGLSSLIIIDVSEPDSLVFVNRIDPNCGDNSSFNDVFVSGEYAYVLCNGNVLTIWDVSDPYNPGSIGYCGLASYSTCVFVAGDYAYVANYDEGLQIVEVSDPTDPMVVGSHDTPDHALDVFVSGHYAYVADYDSGLQIIDVIDPANPTFAANYDTPGSARGVYVAGEYVYVADYDSLLILLYNPATGNEGMDDLPERYALEQNYPNPFNAFTRIDFDIPAETDIDIVVYDVLGRRVATLFEGQKQPGHHSLIWNAGDFPSGIYFATLKAGSRSEVIRMTLLK